MIKMPRRTRTATPPITAPAMRPGDGGEDLLVVAGAMLDIDCVVNSETPEVVILMADWCIDRLVGVLPGGFGVPGGAMLGSRMLGMAVGMGTILWLVKKDATTPPTLLRRLFSWRR